MTEEDEYWYEPLKEECKGDWELPNKPKVESLKGWVDLTIQNFKRMIFGDWGRKSANNEIDNLKAKLVLEVWEHFMRYMVNLFKDYESCL